LSILSLQLFMLGLLFFLYRFVCCFFFFSSRRRHTRSKRDWSSDVCSSDLGASGANAEQESRILMLSKGARGDANPILLIDEDDVTAGHAASVGRIDELQMYYLQSRGITPDEAKRLIIHGFLAPVVKEL